MPGKVPKEVTRQREETAWELRQRGWTHERIAAELEVDRSTVGKMLARIDKRVLARLDAAAGAEKVAQSSQLDYIIDESLRAWERSKAASRTVTKRQAGRKKAGGGDDADAPEESVTQQATEQYGDTGYLDQARAAMADKRKIWGTDAPKKHALTNARGEDLCLDDLKDDLRKVRSWTPEEDKPAVAPPAAPEQAQEARRE